MPQNSIDRFLGYKERRSAWNCYDSVGVCLRFSFFEDGYENAQK
jgi:hypothetical protein